MKTSLLADGHEPRLRKYFSGLQEERLLGSSSTWELRAPWLKLSGSGGGVTTAKWRCDETPRLTKARVPQQRRREPC